jgi:hypothetical protein
VTTNSTARLAEGRSNTSEVLAIRPPRVQDGESCLREKESALNEAPKDFRKHMDHITSLVDQVGDDALRVSLLDSIEVLVKNMNGPWHGAVVVWRFGEVPDDLSEIDGLEDA